VGSSQPAVITARADWDGLDRDALISIGIDATGFLPLVPVPARKPPPLGALTSGDRSVLDSLLAAGRSKNSRHAPNHFAGGPVGTSATRPSRGADLQVRPRPVERPQPPAPAVADGPLLLNEPRRDDYRGR